MTGTLGGVATKPQVNLLLVKMAPRRTPSFTPTTAEVLASAQCPPIVIRYPPKRRLL
jgi:hypothetical protein